jgi:tRNA threonylcarbamoyladenosine biosynthesis protein TsaE
MRESDSTPLIIDSAQDMQALGRQLGAALARSGGPAIVTLGGELGAGKTTLARGLLHALGIEGPIRSPTYTLVEPYESRDRMIYHLDLYRVAGASEVEDLGVRDLLQGDALLLIEWAEKGAGALPAADLHVQISYAPGREQGRRVAFVASTPSGISVLTHFDSVKRQQRQLSS